MKRCWIGAGILVLILVLGLLSGTFLRNFCREASSELTLAAEGKVPAEGIRDRWERHRTLFAMLCDHSSLSAIREEFRVLDPAGENFRETCLRLAAKLEALGDSQRLSWANVF